MVHEDRMVCRCTSQVARERVYAGQIPLSQAHPYETRRALCQFWMPDSNGWALTLDMVGKDTGLGCVRNRAVDCRIHLGCRSCPRADIGSDVPGIVHAAYAQRSLVADSRPHAVPPPPVVICCQMDVMHMVADPRTLSFGCNPSTSSYLHII